MAPGKPDSIQYGGVKVIKPIKKPGRILGSEKTPSLTSVDKVLQIKRDKQPTKKVQSQVLAASQKRVATLKEKQLQRAIVKQQKLQIAQKAQVTKVAAKPVTKKISLVDDARKKKLQSLVATIKANARAKMAKVVALARLKVKVKASVNAIKTSFALKSRLDNLNNNHLIAISESTQAAVGDAAVGIASDHATNLNKLNNSADIIGTAHTRIDAAVNDNIRGKATQATLTGNIADSHLLDSSNDLDILNKQVRDAQHTAADAAISAETARVNAVPLPEKINAKTHELEVAKANQEMLSRDTRAATDVGAIASDLNIKLQKTGVDKTSQQSIQGGYDSSRASAAHDVATNVTEVNNAKTRKTANDTTLTNIETKHQADIATLNANADTAVDHFSSDLGNAKASGESMTKLATVATDKRRTTETDAGTNSSAIVDKQSEVKRANESGTNAQIDYTARSQDVSAMTTKLATDQATAVSAKTGRDIASELLNDNIPVKDPAYSKDTSRRDHIENTDLPTQKTLRDTAEANLHNATNEMNSGGYRDKLAGNTAELATIPHQREVLVAHDIDLQNKLKGSIDAANTTHALRDSLAADLNNKRFALNGDRRYLDDMNNRIKTQELKVGNAPETPAPSAIVVSMTETSASKDHSVALISLKTSKEHVTYVENTLTSAMADLVSLNKKHDTAVESIPRETVNVANLDASRKAIPAEILTAKAERAHATAEADSIAIDVIYAGEDLGMVTNALNYYDPPLKPVRAKIKKNIELAEAIGPDIIHSDNLRTETFNNQLTKYAEMVGVDTARQKSATDANTYTLSHDQAVTRKTNNEAALSGIEAKHQTNINNMKANADTMVANTKSNLDNAKAAVPGQAAAATASTKARSDVEKVVDNNTKAVSAKVDEVMKASRDENAAKLDSQAAEAKTNTVQKTLNDLVDSEPVLGTSRLNELNTVEASKPTRDPVETMMAERKSVIEGSELPKSRKEHNDAAAKIDNLTQQIDGPGGLTDKHHNVQEELNTIANTRESLGTNDDILQGKMINETNNMNEKRSARETVVKQIADTNETIKSYAQYTDAVNNYITAKEKLNVQKPVDVQTIEAQRITSIRDMENGGREHIVAGDNLTKLRTDINDTKAKIADLGAEGATLSTRHDKITENITIEGQQTVKHQGELADTAANKAYAKKEADIASTNAEKAVVGEKDVQAQVDANEQARTLANAELANTTAKISSETNAAVKEGSNAADANTGRNNADNSAKKTGQEQAAYDSARTTESTHEAVYQAEGNAASQRKRVAEGNLEGVSAKHNADIDAMGKDKDGAVKQNKQELDDAKKAASNQYDAATSVTAKRKGSEQDAVNNMDTINEKTKDVLGAQENELFAKYKTDEDAAATETVQKKLDEFVGNEAVTKKLRDDIDAESYRPSHDDTDAAMKDRSAEIDAEVSVLQKKKSEAEAAKDAAADQAAKAKAEKDALPPPEDTSALHANDEILQKRKRDEEKNKKDLEDNLDTVKKSREEGEMSITTKMILAGTIANLISGLMGTPTLPAPAPLLTGEFNYPISSGAYSSSGAVPIGVTPLKDIVAGPSKFTDISGITAMTQIDMGPGISGPGISGPVETYTDFKRGVIAGTQDGKRDATSDAMAVFMNKDDETLKELQAKLGDLQGASQSDINTQINALSEDAYCKEVKDQGIKNNIDIYTAFSECSAYFKIKAVSNPSGPTPGEPSKASYTKPIVSELSVISSEKPTSGPIYGEPSGENYGESSGENYGESMTGGYKENINGVMQFGGDLTSGPVIPSYNADLEYMEGYKQGYKSAYIQTYSLTLAIKITQKISSDKKGVNGVKKNPTGYGEPGYGEPGYGANPEKAIPVGIVTEAAAKVPQTGGFLKHVNLKRGKTLTQHARLLNRIAGRTSAVQSS